MLIKYLLCDCCGVTSGNVSSIQKDLPNWKTVDKHHLCHDCLMIFLDQQDNARTGTPTSLVLDFVKIVRLSQQGMSARTIHKSTGLPLARVRRSIRKFHERKAA